MEEAKREKMRKIGESSSDQREDNEISIRRTNVPIPHDLMLEILARLPAKSLARFLCVSKLWESTIRSRAFANSFVTRSSTRPGLLFVLMDRDLDETYTTKLSFYTTLKNPRNPFTDQSCRLVHLYSLDAKYTLHTTYHSVRGLVSMRSRDGSKCAIFNPNLRKFVTLPVMETDTHFANRQCLLGYDPIGDEYKALLSLEIEKGNVEIRVLTLGDHGWREIEGVRNHFPIRIGRCIDGVLYYKARLHDDDSVKLVCFDVRSESFRFVEYPEGYVYHRPLALINYKGKLAEFQYGFMEDPGWIRLYVLEDAEKHEWSEREYVMPPTWRDLKPKSGLFYNASVTDAGEIVILPCCLHEPSFVMYYNPERDSLERVELEGIPRRRNRTRNGRIGMFITLGDHVENIMFM